MVIENKWYCDIPDITVPTKPDLRWLDEDLGESLTALFPTQSVLMPEAPSGKEPPAGPPTPPPPSAQRAGPTEYRGIYYIPAGIGS